MKINNLLYIILSPLMLIGLILYPLLIFKRVFSGEKCGGWII